MNERKLRAEENSDYLGRHSEALSAIMFLNTPVSVNGVDTPTFINTSLYDFLCYVKAHDPVLFSLLDIARKSPGEWKAIYNDEIQRIDTGGFDHGPADNDGKTGLNYGKLQLDPRFNTSRIAGVLQIVEHIKPGKKFAEDDVLVDVLAGNGTFGRVMRRFVEEKFRPFVIDHDVSNILINEALQNLHHAVRGLVRNSLLADKIAIGAVSAYGSHHVPLEKRKEFMGGVVRLIQDEGRFVLHDFEEGSPTARFYSEAINKNRRGGHNFRHYTPDTMHAVLDPLFRDVAIHGIYAPYNIVGTPGQSGEDLKREALAYLVTLFTLEGFLPNDPSKPGSKLPYEKLREYDDVEYWRALEDKLAPYHTFERGKIKDNFVPPDVVLIDGTKISTPVVEQITVFERGQLFPESPAQIVIPRVDLVAVASGPRGRKIGVSFSGPDDTLGR